MLSTYGRMVKIKIQIQALPSVSIRLSFFTRVFSNEVRDFITSYDIAEFSGTGLSKSPEQLESVSEQYYWMNTYDFVT